MNIIFTCGGTGGHINPAIAVANVLKERHPDSKILFIGGKDNMEEELVPKAGYEIVTFNENHDWHVERFQLNPAPYTFFEKMYQK